jgi:diketogulonate reductase-like aldo/keto reductase
MERRVFGPTGREVSVIGQGTWKLRDHAAAARALARGLELGLDHIDTAELYKGSEATIAPVIAPVVSAGRSDVFLVSKVLPHHADRSGTIAACDASLARLGVDALDVYLLHWPGPHPIEETMHAMAELIDAGKIRAAGVSNFDVAEMEEARDALGGHPLACNQVRYAPDHRGIEEEVLPWCQKHNVAVVGYSSFGSGEFPGGSKARKALAAIGAPHGKDPYQVILDVLSREPNVFLIPKAESVAHVESNAASLRRRLPTDAVAAFNELYPTGNP